VIVIVATYRRVVTQPKAYNCQLLEEKNIYSCEKQEDSSSKEEYPEEPQYEENFLLK